MYVYALKTCNTCRRALKFLSENGCEFTVVDVRNDGVPPETLSEFYSRLGDRLVNRKSATWRNLSNQERARAPVALLQDHPTLMKRPVIVDRGQIFLGWTADVQAALVGRSGGNA